MPDRISKSIRTTIGKGNLEPVQVEQMLTDTDRKTVHPFLASPWNQPERLERFRVIRDNLHQTLGQ